MFKMELEYKDKVLFARLKGTLDRKYSYKINNYLNPLLLKHNIKNLIYNFKELDMVDKAGINALLNSRCYIKLNKGNIRACHVSSNMEYLCKYLKIKIIANEASAYMEVK